MKNNFKKDAYLVDLINESYHYHKRFLSEVENGIKEYDSVRVKVCRKIVGHIDSVANEFTGKTKLIVDNEIIGNLKGSKWYVQYFSAPAYYRARRAAYRSFLENIEK